MSGCGSCSGRLFVPQHWPGGDKTEGTELVALHDLLATCFLLSTDCKGWQSGVWL